MATRSSRPSVLGEIPTAMNTPSTGSSLFSPVFLLVRLKDSTLFSPLMESATVSQRISTFSISISFFWRLFAPLSSFRRWIRYTFSQILARKTASSMATSPPPTTAAVFFLKKAPSQVAQ